MLNFAVCAPHEIVARKRAERFPRDRVFMDIEVEDKMSFRIVIELFSGKFFFTQRKLWFTTK